MAQSPGRYTFHFDRQRHLWEVLGQAETGHKTYTLGGGETPARGTEAEIVRSGIFSEEAIRLTLGPIMRHEDYAGPRTLTAGTYRLALLTPEVCDGATTCEDLNLAIVAEGNHARKIELSKIASTEGYNLFEHKFTLSKSASIKIELDSGSEKPVFLGGLVLCTVED
jgi:hypothetical protein